MKTVVIGTRGSKLALWQARWVAERLEEAGAGARIEVIKTTGDKIRDVALAKVGASQGLKGVFTKEIEEALLDGRIDVAVHSMKDLPTELDRRLAIAAVPPRADPRDAMAGGRLDDLSQGAVVGTSSLRRAAQLRARRPGLRVENIRGNVDTRLRKLDEGRYGAIVLASAGLHRLGLEARISEVLDPAVLCPAVGQGALAVQIRDGDGGLRELLAPLHHPETGRGVAAERALLEALGGGCQAPLGAYAQEQGGRMRLRAVVLTQDGRRQAQAEGDGPADEPEQLGRRLAEQLKERGAAEIMAEAEAAAEQAQARERAQG